MTKWLANLPLYKKLYSIVIAFLVGTLAMAALSTLGMNVLSATRAYVGAEGQWAKAQKEAVYSLDNYALTHDEKWYRRFQDFVKGPHGVKKFRLEMEKPEPDMKVAFAGLVVGGNAPEDFDDMVRLFRQFRRFGYIDKAIHIWADADLALDELENLAGRLYAHRTTHKTHLNAEAQKEEALLLSQIHALNDRLIELENSFSRTLGEASRWAKGLLLGGVLLCMALVAGVGFLFLRLIVKDLILRARSLVQAMEAVAKGEHNLRCDDSAKDEIGFAAASFNKMTAKLQETTVYLVQSEKLNALGELTASISHELKQPLNIIQIISQGLERDIEKNRLKEDELKSSLADVRVQITRMSEIIEHMRLFTRRAEFAMEKHHINEVIEQACKFFTQQLTNRNIELTRSLGSDLPFSMLDAIQLEQVVINLIANAKDAIEGNARKDGKIEIKTHKVNQSVAIQISDNAGGIPDLVLARIFEPFFTTKAPGKGTGLGLSISKKIVENHNGQLAVVTKLGEGSTFTITLPAVAERIV